MNYWYLLALLSALFMTGQELVKKRTLKHKHARSYTTTRVIFVAGLSLFLVPFLQPNLQFEIVFITFIVAVLSSIAILYMTRAVRHMDISVVSPLNNIGPAFVLFFALIFLGETPSFAQLGGIMLLIIGTYLLEVRSHHRTFDPVLEFVKSRYMHYLLGTVIFFSLLSIFEKSILTGFLTPLTYMFLYWCFVMISLVFLQWYRMGLQEVKKEASQHFGSYILGAAFTLGAGITFLTSLLYIPVTIAVPLRKTNTLFTTLIGGRMFKEKNSRMKAAACGIMVAGAFLILM